MKIEKIYVRLLSIFLLFLAEYQQIMIFKKNIFIKYNNSVKNG